jgi:uncharacterized protein DUF3489
VTARERAGILKEVQIMARASKSTPVNATARRLRKSTGKSPKPNRSRRLIPVAAKPIEVELHAPVAPERRSKKAVILALLQRPKGAPISDLIGATGWQAHSVRAALTGLRKEGKELLRVKNASGITHYRLAAETPA